MTDEHKLLIERDRGAKAAQVLDNVIYQDAWARMEANLLATMTAPNTTDDAVLEAKRGLVILTRLQKELKTELETGQLAGMQLQEQTNG